MPSKRRGDEGFTGCCSSRKGKIWVVYRHAKVLTVSRAYALQRHRPLSLQATISLPTEHDDPSDTQSHHLHGFIHLVSLFRPFDEHFVALWNKTRTDCSPTYLAALQKQLTDALPTYLNSTENQAADLRTSQQWLRTMVWQLSIQNGCLSSGHDDTSMTFQYPVEIARDLVAMTSQFSQQSMEVHGIGLVCTITCFQAFLLTRLQIEKLFDVACSLTDVLSLLPANPQPFTMGPRDYLHQFMNLLSVLRSGDSRFLPLLLAKVHDVLPTLANPMLQTVPDTPQNMCAEVDIFDGFGPMGMGVPSNFNGISNSTPSEYKMPSNPEFKLESAGMTRFDKHIEEITSPSHGPESNDSGPFTSPPIIQNSMEFPGLNEYGRFPDMSASNMGNNITANNDLGNYGEGVGGGGRQIDFKREFDASLGIQDANPIRRPPLRQGSGNSFGMQIPRSVPEQFRHLQRQNSGEGVNDLPFR